MLPQFNYNHNNETNKIHKDGKKQPHTWNSITPNINQIFPVNQLHNKVNRIPFMVGTTSNLGQLTSWFT